MSPGLQYTAVTAQSVLTISPAMLKILSESSDVAWTTVYRSDSTVSSDDISSYAEDSLRHHRCRLDYSIPQ